MMRIRKALIGISLLILLLLLIGRVKQQIGLPVWHSQPTATMLIIDAGHGGFDGGASAANGMTEQQINLRMAKKLKSLSGLFGIPTRLTREDEQALDYQPGRTIHENKVADIKAREKIASETENAVFLSVHLNKFEQSQYFGAQTFYSRNTEEGKLLAESVQKALLDGIHNGNNRKAKPAPDTVYLMKRLRCPAVIVECGFLSNPEEAEKLKTEAYQKKLTICILCGYLSVGND